MKQLPAILAGSVAAAVYWRTAYPSINWWDSGQYSIAAYTLGVAGPPGSLLLTLLGWPIAHVVPQTSVAYALNLFAGLLAAITVVLVCMVALRVMRLAGVQANAAVAAGAALGAIAFAVSATVWEYAVQFTPYILTTAFTGLILLTMMRWWEMANEPEAWRQLALLGLLFGLDFSVHRTNALLMPGALIWILMRHPRSLRDGKVWGAGTLAFLAGLSVHLLLIPIARSTQSPLFWNDPTSLSRFWSYISLERLGGGFLLGLFPRHSNLVTEQSADLVRAFGDNFFHWNRTAGALGVLSGVAGGYGLVALWERNRRLGAALSFVLLSQAFMTVLYFNIPADFFRSLDRHYLPVFVTFGVAIACGLGTLLHGAAPLNVGTQRLVALALAGVAVLVPFAAFADGWRTHDASKRHFAADYGRNTLRALPPNAVYFTVGDNDTWPVLYMQAVEGVRGDVQLFHLSLANAPEYIAGIRRVVPSLPLSMTLDAIGAAARDTASDTTMVLPVSGSPEALGVDTIPRDVVLHPNPQYGATMIPGEVVLQDLVRTNAWKRPLTFSITASQSRAWLAPFTRLDGMYWRVVPRRDPVPDVNRLREALVGNQYRGYADPAVIVDNDSRVMGGMYLAAVDALLEAEEISGATSRCATDKSALLAAVPPERVTVAADVRTKLLARCGARVQ